MKFVLTSPFGELSEVREGRPHTGIDIAMPEGTTLRSITDGIVYAIRDYGDKNIGKGVIIQADDGNFHIYGHMSKIIVQKGQHINAGDMIGMSGNTGHSTGPHLHFAIQRPDGSFVDPTQYGEALAGISGNVDPEQVKRIVENVDSSVWDKVKSFFIERGQVNQYSEAARNGDHPFWDWIGGKIADGFAYLWDQFVLYLPDIMGYVTIGAGILIILNAMVNKGGMIKALAWYFGAFILSVIILGSV